ncbi:MAG: hypothetical protein [Wendovervirus sonii]|uniref:Uncharacterized protein n=1 Tax=phage Lak_Megaphage_Sonny TaxID=3109229 RepID=A0ABZ0Z3M8_9CAUD|nr:MAG: hypothetical protein [phage Lak_Megaphage_Sonny]
MENIKEMEYVGRLETPIILASDNYEGFNYYVISYGSHPCGYVEIPENHFLYEVDYDDICIHCHGGLTFSDKLMVKGIEGTYCIGWDYAHCNDYVYYGDDFNKYRNFGNKHTTEEIIAECKYVIEQIQEKGQTLLK